MELLALVFIAWLIGCAFPGSQGQHYAPDLGDVLGFLGCAFLLAGIFFGYWYTVAGMLIAFDHFGISHPAAMLFCFFAPIVIPMLIASFARSRP